MRTTAQQRHAAYCRHAKSSEAKRLYQRGLSEQFQSSRHSSNLSQFASAERAAICRRVHHIEVVLNLQIKRSTLHTWLREWKAAAQNGN